MWLVLFCPTRMSILRRVGAILKYFYLANIKFCVQVLDTELGDVN